MVDNPTPPADGANNGTPPDGANPPTPPAGGDNPNMIPYDRFKEVNEAKKALEAELQAERDKQKAADEAKLAEQGEYKTLLQQKEAELEAAKSKASEWDNYQAAKKESILETWSDDQREAFGDLPLAKIEALDKQFNENRGGGAPSDRPGERKEDLLFGGFSSLKEWALKKPEEYKAWRASQK